ncbi:MAG: C4-dicarboxylate ABC transporter permease [Firmicutes bacterium HGW-Firmicutes-11]|jgi:tripartite ATP-independent transporter DctM subunit|nr:MAG: C4-dicarboxylate ABC transporter permease [Firmicutes bacterium HGW-Firmicutes-11]
MSPTAVGILAVVAFLILMLLRMPIAVSLGLVGVVGFSYLNTPNAAFRLIASDFYNTFASYTLSVVAMFVMMGFLAYYAGLGQKLYSVAYRIMGRVPGGLAMSSVLACVVFGAVCGSNPATTATIGSIAIPEMRKYKYKDTLSTGSIAASGAIGAMIPPSVIFIIYGTSTQISVSRLFLSGIIPGLLLALFYIITIWILVKRNPELAPIQLTETGEYKKEKIEAEGLLEVGIVFVVSLGGLFAGWFTPTEAGAIGAAGVLVITLIRRQIDWKGISLALRATTRTTAMIMFLIAGATIFGRLVAVSRIPFALATYVGNLEMPNIVIILITMVIYLVLGTFLDTIPCILLTIPIFYPVIVEQLGNDPIWFGVFILMVSSMGVVTPPVGINVYVVKGLVKDIPIETIFRGVMPFLLAAFILTLLIIVFPQIATFLPNLLLGP